MPIGYHIAEGTFTLPVDCSFTIHLRVEEGHTFRRLTDTVNYEEVIEILRDCCAVPARLVEELAERAEKKLKEAFNNKPQVEKIELRLTKGRLLLEGVSGEPRSTVELTITFDR